MSINLTLIIQMLVFAALVWFTMERIWPLLLQALDERQKRIADGLAAAERGHRELEEAEKRTQELIGEGRAKANELVEQAKKRSDEILEEARVAARAEGERLRAAAQADAERGRSQARGELRAHVAALALAGAERILQREVDRNAHAELLQQLGTELAS